MGFFTRLVSPSAAAEYQNKKALESARDISIKMKKKLDPSRSVESIAAEYDAQMANSPRARDERLFKEDRQYWEDIAAGRISKDTMLPSKAYFASLSPQEQQAEQNRKQQIFQASQIRTHNSRVDSVAADLQNRKALGMSTEFQETELKKLTAQQPVFAPIGAAPIVNVNIDSKSTTSFNNLSEVGNDEIWEQVAAECESSERREALWIKCFSQADGDENKAKALYYQT